jgi:D-sedoheptulose 7-phosphate isomerase
MPPGAREYVDEVKRVLDALPDQLEPFVEELYQAYVHERTVFLIGNGGSAANASHFAQDLNKGTLSRRGASRRFRAVSLTDNVSFITALANDEGYESVFVEQLVTLGRPGDILVALSGSGNSPNVLRAVDYANGRGITTLGMTGFDGGGLGTIARVSVRVPSQDIGLVEAVHAVVFHLTVSQLRQRLDGGFGPGGGGH